jgi:tyrosyl-tRNA synthetase
MDKFDLISRNTEEIVKEEELKRLIESKERPRAYAGYEPSGSIHLGHALTVNKLIDLQRAGFEITVLMADVNAYLNEKGSFEELQEVAERNKECFLALGLEKNTRFISGSDYQMEGEYMENVLRLSREITLKRAKRSMDEVSRRRENPMVSQMIYPLMQVMDIPALKADVAVGGIDQRKIHMLARENLPKFGFNPPICIHTSILIGLDGKKMSSSKKNYISVEDKREDLERKIIHAFCPAKITGDNPVLQLFKYYVFPRFDEITIKREDRYGGEVDYTRFDEMETDFYLDNLHPLDLKRCAVDYLEEIISPIREVLS